MLLDKWNPVFSPDVDAGAAEPAVEAPPPINETPADGPGSGRGAIRKELEKSVDTTRKAERSREAPPKKYVSTARKNAEEQGTAPAEEAAPAEGEEVAAAEPETAAPEGWAKEAKAEWQNLPPVIQAAVTKREVDMAKGVEELKNRYAEIDKVLQPRLETIRQHGHTPAQAINQLWSWFEALSANPATSFPALANSFKFDLRSIPGLVPPELIQLWKQHQATQQQGKQPAPAQPGQPTAEQPEAVSPAVQQYIDQIRAELGGLKQEFAQQLGNLNSSFQQQTQAKTNEILANWARDKPHFEEVRRTMAQLIQSNAVPPLPDGTADLDRAYDMAMWGLPEVRSKLQAEQQAAAAAAQKAKLEAEKKAQQEQANKARRAQGGSLNASAPGAPVLPVKGKRGKTVAESLRESIAELSE